MELMAGSDHFERAVERDLPLLRQLVDPGEPIKGGVRATPETRRALRRLEASGLAVSNKGWWRKSRDGVLLLRKVASLDAAEERRP